MSAHLNFIKVTSYYSDGFIWQQCQVSWPLVSADVCVDSQREHVVYSDWWYCRRCGCTSRSTSCSRCCRVYCRGNCCRILGCLDDVCSCKCKWRWSCSWFSYCCATVCWCWWSGVGWKSCRCSSRGSCWQ